MRFAYLQGGPFDLVKHQLPVEGKVPAQLRLPIPVKMEVIVPESVAGSLSYKSAHYNVVGGWHDSVGNECVTYGHIGDFE